MNTKAFFPCAGGSNLTLGIGTETIYLSTEWVHYVEEPMKYQAFLPHFFSVVGWWVVEWGWWSGWWGEWCGGWCACEGWWCVGGWVGGVVVCWVWWGMGVGCKWWWGEWIWWWCAGGEWVSVGDVVEDAWVGGCGVVCWGWVGVE